MGAHVKDSEAPVGQRVRLLRGPSALGLRSEAR